MNTNNDINNFNIIVQLGEAKYKATEILASEGKLERPSGLISFFKKHPTDENFKSVVESIGNVWKSAHTSYLDVLKSVQDESNPMFKLPLINTLKEKQHDLEKLSKGIIAYLNAYQYSSVSDTDSYKNLIAIKVGSLEVISNEEAKIEELEEETKTEQLLSEFSDFDVIDTEKGNYEQELYTNALRINNRGGVSRFFQKIGSGLSTGIANIKDRISPLTTDKALQRVVSRGNMLADTDVSYFLQSLEDIDKFKFTRMIDFMHTPITSFSLSDAKAVLSNLKDPQEPIVIPIVIAKDELFGRNHITSIIIKDGTVRYFDSKGALSGNVALLPDVDGNKNTLRDFLEFLRDTYAPGGPIYENEVVLQFDAHNCGVFVCKDIYEQIIGNHPIDEFSKKIPTEKELVSFRTEVMGSKIRAYKEYEEETYGKKPVSNDVNFSGLNDFDEFENLSEDDDFDDFEFLSGEPDKGTNTSPQAIPPEE